MLPVKREDQIALFHGTSSKRCVAIETSGLDCPYLTDDPEIAAYYAEVATEEEGGSAVIFSVSVQDLRALRYDGAAMDEPVLVDEEDRDAVWREAAQNHPEWTQGTDTIICPPEAWEVSLAGARSVRCAERIPTEMIRLEGG